MAKRKTVKMMMAKEKETILKGLIGIRIEAFKETKKIPKIVCKELSNNVLEITSDTATIKKIKALV